MARVWESKDALLAGGSAVRGLQYQRASRDRKKQGKSVGDQKGLNVTEIISRGWTVAGSFTDNARSASRYAHREREEFALLLAAIEAGRGDVLVMWEVGRSQRDLAVYAQLRDLCTRCGLFFWLVGGALFDLRDRNDRMSLGLQAVQAEFQAEYIRDNVARGVEGAARAGKPHGRITYGYRRIYDQRTKALLRQEADREPRTTTDHAGNPVEYSRAGVVEEIFDRLSAGDPLSAVETDLTVRGIPAPRGGASWARVVRRIALNPAYVGKREWRGAVVADAVWEPLIAEETFWAVSNLLTAPQRRKSRSGRAVHLLSHLARCGKCGSVLQAERNRRSGQDVRMYVCKTRRCVGVKAAHLDEYIERLVIEWLSRAEVFAMVSAVASDSDERASRARAKANQLRADLETWRKAAESGTVTAESFSRVEKARLTEITEAEEAAKQAAMPPVLRGMTGAQAQARWAELGELVAVKRQIIKDILDIKVHPVGSGRQVPIDQRVTHTWKLTPDPTPAIEETA